MIIYLLDTLCFNQRDVTIIEGDRSSTIKLDLSTSKRLSRPVRVDFNYSNGTGHPATRSPVPRGELYSNYAYTQEIS